MPRQRLKLRQRLLLLRSPSQTAFRRSLRSVSSSADLCDAGLSCTLCVCVGCALVHGSAYARRGSGGLW